MKLSPQVRLSWKQVASAHSHTHMDARLCILRGNLEPWLVHAILEHPRFEIHIGLILACTQPHMLQRLITLNLGI